MLEDLGEKETLSDISLRRLIEPVHSRSACEKMMEQQQKAESFLASHTTSISPKGCSLVAIGKNDCGLLVV